MKYLKYALIIIIALVAIFFLRGLLTSSISYESEVIVNKPAKECWTTMTDQSKMSRWIKGYKRSELVSGEENTVGAISNVYVEDQGQETVMKETIKKIEANKLINMEFSMDIMNMDYEMSMEEEDGQTTIKTVSKVSGNGILYKSMVAFMEGAMKDQEDENLMNLKKVIEEN